MVYYNHGNPTRKTKFHMATGYVFIGHHSHRDEIYQDKTITEVLYVLQTLRQDSGE